MTTTLIPLTGIVLLGASVQWLTGMGFALVAVPALILLLGPAQGVALANCAAGAISVVGLAGGLRRVRLAAMVPLCAAAACTVPAGTWLTHRLPPPYLLLTMGALVTVAVLLVMRGARLAALGGRGGALTAGAVGGFMNSAAGVGGPPVSLYALNAGWTVREFVPNAQFYGVVVNAFSVTANGIPALSAAEWTAVGTAMVAGGVIGTAVGDRLPEHHARRLVLLLALTGGATAVAKGVWAL
ncbi:sulfite exporter TauE/SafE family protein [Streptomyces fuscichromogenes]|uniref:Probable membrane transporter protein n=1 Tax=Streptomyces fuscichromogenes TaxID=1324013 RepID=A0A918CR79_9ACTN|nr:sulfite exporter TauE/SafE family protein [Streptomyces fuscichromogenes]GGN06695.1 membrane protein [Streptomyces fuscichromogenes]